MKTLLASLVSLALLAPSPALAQDENQPDFEELPPGYTPPPPGPSGEPEELPAEEGPASDMDYETFHEALSPYGNWNYTDDYGWVWTPSDVAQDWRPYSDGEWLWTSYGWTWSGSEPWAWAPYHYGRWCYVPYIGWGWVPGYTWGPAWVAWRVGAGYVGWTPLYPGYPYGGPWLGTYPIYYNQWCFTGYGTFWGAPVYPSLYPTSYVQSTVWPHTHSVVPVQSGGAVYHGPSHSVVAAAVGHPITPVNIHPVASASQAGFHATANAMNVYAPRFHAAAHPFTSPRGGMAPSISASRPRGVGSLTRQGPVAPAGHAVSPVARSGVAPVHAPPKAAPNAQPYRGGTPVPSSAPRGNNGGGVGHGVSHPAPQSQRSPFPTGTFSTYHSDPGNAASGEPRSEPEYAAAANAMPSGAYVSSAGGESRGPSPYGGGYGGQSTRTYSNNAYGGGSHPSYNTVRPTPAGGGSQTSGGYRGASHPSYGGGGSHPVPAGGVSHPSLANGASHPPSLGGGSGQPSYAGGSGGSRPSSSGGATSVHAAPSGGGGGGYSAGGRH